MSKQHQTHLSYPSPQRPNRLTELNSPPKTLPFHFRPNQLSLFSISPRKASNPEALQKRRKHSRIDSLNNLMKKCTDISLNNKSTKHLSSHNKTASESIKRIKRSLNLNTSQGRFEEITGKNLKKDAQEMSKHLNAATQNLRTGETVWKFRSKALPKSTEKLILQITQRLSSRTSLKTVFHCIK